MPTKGTLLVEGTYTVQHGEIVSGYEMWKLSKLAHGGLLFVAHREVTQPQPVIWNVTYEITQHWVPIHLSLRVDAAGKTIASDQRPTETQWTARVGAPGKTASDYALDWTNKSEIASASPVFIAVTLVHLNLQVGQSRQVGAILIDPTTLEPRAIQQTYACSADEKIEIAAGKFSAWHYTLRVGDAQSEDHFWADRQGIVLKYESADGIGVRLTRYRRIERR